MSHTDGFTKTKTMIKLTMFTVVLVLALRAPEQVFAQDAPSVPAASPSTSAICMVSPASLTADGSTITVAVPLGSDASLAAQGYQVTPCPQQPGAFASYSASICQLASASASGVPQAFQNTFGVSPNDLCIWAGQITGMP